MIDLTYQIGYLIGLIIWYRYEIMIGLSAGVLFAVSIWFVIRFLKGPHD